MQSKLLGGILLVVGTSIGGGMLGLPIVAANFGFLGTICLLVACWLFILVSALLFLEVILWFPPQYNFISIAKATLGIPGQVITWATYLMLLYALLCAYIASSGDLLASLLLAIHIKLSFIGAAAIVALLFASIVACGVMTVDYVNRWLMIIKFLAYVLLTICLLPKISYANLLLDSSHQLNAIAAFTVALTSFGFSVLIPSLRVYVSDNVRSLRKIIIIGSLVPLLCYLLWSFAIMGTIPRYGNHSLTAILHSNNPTTQLLTTINFITHSAYINLLAKLFTGICVLTSLLGVSLCLTDFIADGLRLTKSGNSAVLIYLLTFTPALVIIFLTPNVFLQSLQYAGIYVMILSVLLPVMMVWQGRYHSKIASGFTVRGGKGLLIILLTCAVIFLISNVVTLL
jgi:tyrosine-specific transport protein